MGKYDKKYFLGANSCTGFYSAFCESYQAEDNWKAYIIKGGPGTGKSSFMKFVATESIKSGLDCELCVCSSDPQSLDGVILPQLKTIILDGTSPHIVEPTYPGVCETLLNFGQYWDEKALFGKSTEIINITKNNKTLHKMASRYMQAYGQLMTDNLKIASACTDKDKALVFADTLCKKNIPQKSGNGHEWVRFIEGITPLGVVSYPKTITENISLVIPIADDYGAAAGIITDYIRNYALASGYNITTLRNPFLPDTLIDHIIIPELSLAIVTENEYMHFETYIRRVHSRRFTNNAQLHNSRKRIQFNRKTMNRLLLSAAETLSDAKTVHDELEKHYISAMNFPALTQFANDFTDKILGNI